MEIYRKREPKVKKKQPNGRPPQWTEEYMHMVAGKVVDEGMTYREAAKLFGVSHGSVYSWIKKYKKGKIGPYSNLEKEKVNKDLAIYRLEEQVQQLKAEIGDLYIQNQLLKKAVLHSRQKKNESSSVITSENLDQFQKGVK